MTRPQDSSNIIPIPDPSKLLDPIYLTAHALVDQIPRPSLARLIPLLMRSTATASGSAVPDHRHRPDHPPPDIPPERPPDKPPLRFFLRRLNP